MTTSTMLQYFGLSFHPFLPDIPTGAIHISPPVELFCKRVQNNLADGGYALITGDSGAGKSVVLRYLASCLAHLPDVCVAHLDHPQSSVANFYREIGDLFGVQLACNNRFGGFKLLRQRWAEHINTTLHRPVLLIDEAQEMPPAVFSEIRSLASKEFDSRSLLCVVLSGDSRMKQRLREIDMLPLATRIRRRLQLDPLPAHELRAALDLVLATAGNQGLLSDELKTILSEQSIGNFRVMMNSAEELLLCAFERQRPSLDEQLFFDVFSTKQPRPSPRKQR
jgi:general secretion pathway protein A